MKINELMKERAVIYCYTHPEVIAQRIQKRTKETGKLLPQHKVNSFEELVEQQKETLKVKEEFVNILRDCDVPVLRINTSDNLQENAKKVNDFIKNLQQETLLK